ncbi:GNAT family N-acetyltransferase [Rouxiella chamberiensis]|nr:GNAT family N-acetyltransferase [Rouxiella chamberiensis]
MLIAKLLGWEEGSIIEYRECYEQFGGNFSTHPDAVQTQNDMLNLGARYFIRTNGRGDKQGGICVWDGNMLANDYDSDRLTQSLALPVAKDELILPISRSGHLILPFKSKIISSKHSSNIINSTFSINAKRRICVAKDIGKLSVKTRQSRKREYKKFIESGGKVHRVEDFTTSELVEIYSTLFFKRRSKKMKNKSELINFLECLKPHIFGCILFIDDSPVAFQLIMKAESLEIISYDYINIGLDTSYSKLSLGTLITWLNLNDASRECQRKEKEMRFSFGRPTAEYKNRWCTLEFVGRIITL